MDAWVDSGIALIATFIASSGFWAYFQRKDKTRSATERLLMGLAYDKIATVGFSFIERGWVTKDEFEEFQKYLYMPYRELGGNGVAERVMTEVSHLPLMAYNRYSELINAKRGSKEQVNDKPHCPHCGKDFYAE